MPSKKNNLPLLEGVSNKMLLPEGKDIEKNTAPELRAVMDETSELAKEVNKLTRKLIFRADTFNRLAELRMFELIVQLANSPKTQLKSFSKELAILLIDEGYGEDVYRLLQEKSNLFESMDFIPHYMDSLDLAPEDKFNMLLALMKKGRDTFVWTTTGLRVQEAELGRFISQDTFVWTINFALDNPNINIRELIPDDHDLYKQYSDIGYLASQILRYSTGLNTETFYSLTLSPYNIPLFILIRDFSKSFSLDIVDMEDIVDLISKEEHKAQYLRLFTENLLPEYKGSFKENLKMFLGLFENEINPYAVGFSSDNQDPKAMFLSEFYKLKELSLDELVSVLDSDDILERIGSDLIDRKLWSRGVGRPAEGIESLSEENFKKLLSRAFGKNKNTLKEMRKDLLAEE